MAEVTGPTHHLPGDRVDFPDGTRCDEHPDRLAVARVTGEVDSFGSEQHDCCQECLDEIRNAPSRTGTCDWCRTPNQILRPRRDYEEGMTGRVYDVCDPCIKKDNARIAAEIAEDEEYEVYDSPDYDGVYTDERSRY